jgi:hypothetical protein
MFRSSRHLLLPSVVVGVLVWSVGGTQTLPGAVGAAGAAEAFGAGAREVIAVNVRGAGPREPSAPNRYVRTFDVYPITGGDRIGTVVQDFAFTSATTGDHVMTFRLRDGQFVNHTVISFAPDTAHSGFVFTGLHPKSDTIVADRGTGRFAGRSGRLRMAGWHDVNKFPDVAVLDDFYVIELDPLS